MANVGRCVGVGNGGGDVEFIVWHLLTVAQKAEKVYLIFKEFADSISA